MFGECTDGAKVQSEPKPGQRIFYSAELSRVAAERCTTAKEAVLLIGELIETYGYYGTGETLPIADPEEGWVMEMAPSPEGTGGLWVAKYDDGYINAPGEMAQEVGYPEEWYEKSKWPQGPTSYSR
ncbi:MAG: C69 family dipeptidase [Desulfovermiculus sp.]